MYSILNSARKILINISPSLKFDKAFIRIMRLKQTTQCIRDSGYKKPTLPCWNGRFVCITIGIILWEKMKNKKCTRTWLQPRTKHNTRYWLRGCSSCSFTFYYGTQSFWVRVIQFRTPWHGNSLPFFIAKTF